jgi:hypothetical protein
MGSVFVPAAHHRAAATPTLYKGDERGLSADFDADKSRIF